MSLLLLVSLSIQAASAGLFTSLAMLDVNRGWRWPVGWGLMSFAEVLIILRRAMQSGGSEAEIGLACAISILKVFAAIGFLIQVTSGRAR